MQYIKMADDLTLSKVVAGFMHAADREDNKNQILSFVEGCLDLGIDTMDHASCYGFHDGNVYIRHCETLFGDYVLRKKPSLRQKMHIVTKCGVCWPNAQAGMVRQFNADGAFIKKSVEQSLNNLATDYIDLLLLHRPDHLMQPEETAQALSDLIAEGKIRHVGVSNFSPEKFDMLQSYCDFRLVTNQIRTSIDAPELLFNGWLDKSLKDRLPLMAWGALGCGRFFKDNRPEAQALKNKLEVMKEKYQTAGIEEIMYAWLNRIPVEMCILTGSTNLGRVAAAVRSLDITLSRNDWYSLFETAQRIS